MPLEQGLFGPQALFSAGQLEGAGGGTFVVVDVVVVVVVAPVVVVA